MSYLFFGECWAESGDLDKSGFKELVTSLMLKNDLEVSKTVVGDETIHALWGIGLMVWMEKKGSPGQTHGERLAITWVPTNGKLSSSHQISGSGAGGDTLWPPFEKQWRSQLLPRE